MRTRRGAEEGVEEDEREDGRLDVGELVERARDRERLDAADDDSEGDEGVVGRDERDPKASEGSAVSGGYQYILFGIQ